VKRDSNLFKNNHPKAYQKELKSGFDAEVLELDDEEEN
jgi:hypothetical protein